MASSIKSLIEENIKTSMKERNKEKGKHKEDRRKSSVACTTGVGVQVIRVCSLRIFERHLNKPCLARQYGGPRTCTVDLFPTCFRKTPITLLHRQIELTQAVALPVVAWCDCPTALHEDTSRTSGRPRTSYSRNTEFPP